MTRSRRRPAPSDWRALASLGEQLVGDDSLLDQRDRIKRMTGRIIPGQVRYRPVLPDVRPLGRFSEQRYPSTGVRMVMIPRITPAPFTQVSIRLAGPCESGIFT